MGGGHVQVNAVGTGKGHCAVWEWGSSGTTLDVAVQCYGPTGVPMDTKFTVLFQSPTPHVAYTYANQPSTPTYQGDATYTWNPAGAGATITRRAVGDYTVVWPGVEVEVIDGGTVQVSSASEAIQCKATGLFNDTGVQVHCFGPNGAPADAHYTVLLGS